ncbi:MAG: F420-0--gamma-glutamyl ligase, partial [Dehalococcoidia bacterium]|nr:F420-0--gamma-glutamyl ligase [Dehalococcoidia bacterium]
MAVSVIAVEGLPEIAEGDDLAAMIVESAAAGGVPLADGDIVIVTSKIVSKSEGRTVDLDTVEPSPFARDFAERWEKEPGIVELVLRESKRVVRQVGPVLITETRHGFVCA